MSRKIYTIYKATNLSNGMVYIGMTGKPLKQRIAGHKYAALKGKSAMKFHAALRGSGIESFEFAEIAQCRSRDGAIDTEAQVISEHMATCGGLMLNTSPRWGKHGVETLSKIGASSKGRACNESTKQKFRSKIVFEFNHPDHGSFVCTAYELRVIFNNLHRSHLAAVCHGKQPHHRGWRVSSTTSTEIGEK